MKNLSLLKPLKTFLGFMSAWGGVILLLSAGSLKGQETLCNKYGTTTFTEYGTSPSSVTMASNLPSTNYGSGTALSFQGTLIVDVNLTFTECIIKMGAGASIIVQSQARLTFKDSEVFACERMWRGVTVQNLGAVTATGTVFEDAQYCFVFASPKAFGTIFDNTFNRNYIGIDIRNIPYFSAPKGFWGNKFTCTSNLNVAYIGQSPAPDDRSYCGIRLENAGMQIGLFEKPNNEFEDMSFGVIALQSDITLAKGIFREMLGQAAGFQIYPSGTGILSIGGSLRVNYSGPGPNDLTFFSKNPTAGIFSAGTDLEVFASKFEENVTGIRSISNTNGQDIEVENCLFNRLGRAAGGNVQDTWGIYLERSNASNTIFNNDFYTDSAPTISGIAFGIRVVGQTSGGSCAVTYNYFENFAEMPLQFISIKAGSADNYFVNFNTLHFNEQTQDETTRWGIAIDNGTGFGHSVLTNIVSGDPGVRDGKTYICGFHIERFPNTRLCYSTTDYGYRGYHFMRNGNPMYFGENHCGNHQYGLHLNPPYTEIGKQVRTLNTWETASGAYTDWAALNQSQFWENSIFTVHQNNALYIPSLTLRSPTDWFDVVTGDENYCTQVFQLYLTEFDITVADSSYVSYSDTALWDARRRVMYKLFRFPELLGDNAAVDSFYYTGLSQSYGLYAQSDYNLYIALLPSDTLMDALADIHTEISYWSDSLAVLDSLLDGNILSDSTLAVQFGQVSDTLAAWVSALQDLRDSISGRRNTALTALEGSLATLVAGTAQEQARRDYLDLMIRHSRGDTLSAADSTDIETLALSDPDVYGDAVGDVSVLLPPGHLLDSIRMTVCLSTEERPLLSNEQPSDAAADLFIAPNPFDEYITLLLPTGRTEAEFFLFDMKGNAVLTRQVNGSGRISLKQAQLSPGNYVAVLKFPDGAVTRQMIQKTN